MRHLRRRRCLLHRRVRRDRRGSSGLAGRSFRGRRRNIGRGTRLWGSGCRRRARHRRSLSGRGLRCRLAGKPSLHLRELCVLQLKRTMLIRELRLQSLNLCLQRLDLTGGCARGRRRARGAGATLGCYQPEPARASRAVARLLRAATPGRELPVDLGQCHRGRDRRDRGALGNAKHGARAQQIHVAREGRGVCLVDGHHPGACRRGGDCGPAQPGSDARQRLTAAHDERVRLAAVGGGRWRGRSCCRLCGASSGGRVSSR